MDEYDCAYCGKIATDVDHVPPVSRKDEMQPVDRFCLPACRECNGALSNHLILNPADRRQYVRDWLRKRYGKLLRSKDWTDVELKEFGPTLRKKLRAGVKDRHVLDLRLRFNGQFTFLPYYEDRRL